MTFLYAMVMEKQEKIKIKTECAANPKFDTQVP